MRPRIGRNNGQTFRETSLNLVLPRVVPGLAVVVEFLHDTVRSYLTRTGETAAALIANVTYDKQIAAAITDISRLCQPVWFELILQRQVVLVKHLVVDIRIYENKVRPDRCRKRLPRLDCAGY